MGAAAAQGILAGSLRVKFISLCAWCDLSRFCGLFVPLSPHSPRGGLVVSGMEGLPQAGCEGIAALLGNHGLSAA